jgi:hypothetical protein
MSDAVQSFFITVLAPGERQQAIQMAREQILKNQGTILDFKMPSDLSLTLSIELVAYDCLELIREMIQNGWGVDSTPKSSEFEGLGDELLQGSIHITFPEAHGDVRVSGVGISG